MTTQNDLARMLNASKPPARVAEVLSNLYLETMRVDPALRAAAISDGVEDDSHPDFYRAMNGAYMPVTPEFGNLLYLLARSNRARVVVEFGTSFGISTIFLAMALRDNGGGRLVSTEISPKKAATATANLTAAGLNDLVEIRVGDATLTLADDLPDQVDLLLLDGSKALYLDVFRLLEHRFVTGSVIACDNPGMTGAQSYLDYVRDPPSNYSCAALSTFAAGSHHGHELVVRR